MEKAKEEKKDPEQSSTPNKKKKILMGIGITWKVLEKLLMIIV